MFKCESLTNFVSFLILFGGRLSITVIVKKCHFDIVIKRFGQPPLSPNGELFESPP
jgi:hypothetical protein